ncbi:hypothetical protein BLA29_006728 [Euroglyphus maynei]|uniref:Uncharacterized protein n=1 Tax=Euroglyphus maynei TaxID=6958 RepID=A0A1Y3AQF8_EURMA|nr:hypothetical protein BLA29_006728 [Euroglyphus maynei]
MTNGQIKPLVIEIILNMPNIVALNSLDKSDGNAINPPACTPFIIIVIVVVAKNNRSSQLATVTNIRNRPPPNCVND